MLLRKSDCVSNIGKSALKVRKYGGYIILTECLEKVVRSVTSSKDGEGYMDSPGNEGFLYCISDSPRSLWTTWQWVENS